MQLRNFKTSKERREALEKETKSSLKHIGHFSFSEEQVGNRNIENLIGAAQVPLGVAGPLQVKSEKLKVKSFFIPLATTEGALVASVSRGCKAVNESGGVITHAFRVGTTRGPVFFTGSLEKTNLLFAWIKEHEDVLKEEAAMTSSHVRLTKIRIKSIANYVFVRFYFDTGDAMGMNMVTIATEQIAKRIEEETGISCLSVAGNFDIDKKPAALNFIENRGWKVWAEAVITKDVLQTILKTTAEQMFEVWLGKCMLGSAMSGSFGFNAHYANIISAVFIATGQDAAHVVEGSMGITSVRSLKNGDLYVSIYLPALMIGTVGGGTGLPTQKEALELMGVFGTGRVEEFAHKVGGAVLAGELSLLASLSEGSLAKSHERLGRAKKV